MEKRKEGLTELRVDEFASPCDITVERSTPVREIIDILREKNIRHLPVMEQGRFVGIISEREVNAVSQLEWGGNLTADQIMIPDPYVVPQGTRLLEVVEEMAHHKYGSVLIKNRKDGPSAIFTTTDALGALIQTLRSPPVEGTVSRG